MFAYLVDRYFIRQPRLRRLLTRAFWGDRDRPVEVFGTRLFANTVKENGYHRAARLASHSSLWRDEAPILLTLAAALRDGDAFVDVGANVGLYCTALARRARIGARVKFYAYEANPDTYARLVESARGLDISTRNLALSDRSGELQFVPGAVSHVFTTVEHASAYNFRGASVPVRCVRLDDEIQGESSIVMKIDVEGQERAVLEGASGLFDSNRVRIVYCDGFKERRVMDFLSSRGFDLLDGHTLTTAKTDVFALLAIKRS